MPEAKQPLTYRVYAGADTRFGLDRLSSFQILIGEAPTMYRPDLNHLRGAQVMVAFEGAQAVGFIRYSKVDNPGTHGPGILTAYTFTHPDHRKRRIALEMRKALASRYPRHEIVTYHAQHPFMLRIGGREQKMPRRLVVKVGGKNVLVPLESTSIGDSAWFADLVLRRMPVKELHRKLEETLREQALSALRKRGILESVSQTLATRYAKLHSQRALPQLERAWARWNSRPAPGHQRPPKPRTLRK